jgi:DNA-directed RNA polymerase subunit F
MERVRGRDVKRSRKRLTRLCRLFSKLNPKAIAELREILRKLTA